MCVGLFNNFVDPAPNTRLASYLGLAEIVLCPGTLTFVLAIDIEPGSAGFLVMWLIIAVINFAVYSVIGVGYVALLGKQET